MDKCKVCANADNEYCSACDNGNQFKSMTNADYIRSMTDEELAEFFTFCDSCVIFKDECRAKGYACKQRWIDWLKQEVDDG